MGQTYLGKVSVHGVNGQLAFTGVVVGDNIMTDGSMTHSFDTFKLKDGIGKTRGVAAVNEKNEATFTIIPIGATEAEARALVIIPGMLGAVTVWGFCDATAAALEPGVPYAGTNKINELRGRWTYVGGATVSASQGDFVKITIPCRRYGPPGTPTIPAQS